ncbi:MAG: septum site-determining protein MinC [Firmicutes bacterium]|nr:septum site-determining protein MinC [Bacillota bacterium]
MKREDIVIRGMRNGILISFDDSLGIDEFYSQLSDKLEDAEVRSMFGAGQVILDLGSRDVSGIQMTEAADFLNRYGLSLQRIIARPEAGPPLIVDRDQVRQKKKVSRPKAVPDDSWPMEAEEPVNIRSKSVSAGAAAESRIEAKKEEAAGFGNITNGDGNTLLIKRNLRSGQTIEHPGNVVIMGDVNPGAEVIAGGNIVVWGSFRGIAHAGATGDENSTITAFRLRPTQLRIAGHITRAPDDDEAGPEIPEIARIRGGVVVIERYQ